MRYRWKSLPILSCGETLISAVKTILKIIGILVAVRLKRKRETFGGHSEGFENTPPFLVFRQVRPFLRMTVLCNSDISCSWVLLITRCAAIMLDSQLSLTKIFIFFHRIRSPLLHVTVDVKVSSKTCFSWLSSNRKALIKTAWFLGVFHYVKTGPPTHPQLISLPMSFVTRTFVLVFQCEIPSWCRFCLRFCLRFCCYK